MENRKRSENFTEEEKKEIVNYVWENRFIIENKSNNSRMSVNKKKKWEELAKKLCSAGRERKWTELRSAYQRWKVAAKKNVTADKKKGSTLGGGPQEIKASELDYLIKDISPDDFVEDRNHFDSNGVEEISPKETGTPSGCSS
ncbi:hypothetical protein ABEB36_013792 [Hypothenemus hampei]|uniref:Regulatory protein zeste n=1 Tax=Hypothenemus hampei TaxID=57062 RepID=A0ABD1E5A2_HYPHA